MLVAYFSYFFYFYLERVDELRAYVFSYSRELKTSIIFNTINLGSQNFLPFHIKKRNEKAFKRSCKTMLMI